MSTFSLEGKAVVVIGCDIDLGQGMVLGLAKAGCDIVGINIVEPTETIEYVATLGYRLSSLIVSLHQIDDIPALLEHAMAEPGRTDILVNDVGFIRRDDAIDFSEKDRDDVMNLNIRSIFFMSQAVAEHSIAQGNGGKVVNIISMLPFQGGTCVPPYTVSKSGIMGAIRLVANEWAKHNTNVNVIAPGCMVANDIQQLRADEQRSAGILDCILAGCWGLPDDLMGSAMPLASNASDCINGYTVVVDGDWLAR